MYHWIQARQELLREPTEARATGLYRDTERWRSVLYGMGSHGLGYGRNRQVWNSRCPRQSS